MYLRCQLAVEPPLTLWPSRNRFNDLYVKLITCVSSLSYFQNSANKVADIEAS